MTEDELDELAIALAEETVARTGEPATAAAVLYQASASVLFAHFPADQIGPALKEIMELAHADIEEALGKGATIQ